MSVAMTTRIYTFTTTTTTITTKVLIIVTLNTQLQGHFTDCVF